MSASWLAWEWAERPVDLSERGAGFIEGFAAACASMTYALNREPDAGKSYDPMKVDLERGTMHSYVFGMKDGGPHHPLAAYGTYQEVADVLLSEALDTLGHAPEIACRSIARIASRIEARERQDNADWLDPKGAGPTAAGGDAQGGAA